MLCRNALIIFLFFFFRFNGVNGNLASRWNVMLFFILHSFSVKIKSSCEKMSRLCEKRTDELSVLFGIINQQAVVSFTIDLSKEREL